MWRNLQAAPYLINTEQQQQQQQQQKMCSLMWDGGCIIYAWQRHVAKLAGSTVPDQHRAAAAAAAAKDV
jgi:hypothetical protein